MATHGVADTTVTVRKSVIKHNVLKYFNPFGSRDIDTRSKAIKEVRTKLLNFNQNAESPIEAYKKGVGKSTDEVYKNGVGKSTDEVQASEANGFDHVDGKITNIEPLKPTLTDYLTVVLRLSLQCPFPDIRQACAELLEDLSVSK